MAVQRLVSDAGFADEPVGVAGTAAVDAAAAEGHTVAGETAAIGHAAVTKQGGH